MAGEVDVDGAPPPLGRQLPDRGRIHHPGVVDQDRDRPRTPAVLLGRAHRGGPIRLGGHVQPDRAQRARRVPRPAPRPASASTSPITTCAPSAASARTCASPIPRAPPDTIATRPFSRGGLSARHPPTATLVGDRLLPFGRAERDRDVADVGVGPASVPVALTRLEPDHVPRHDRAAVARLVDGQAATVGDDQDLPGLVPVPMGSHARAGRTPC